MDVKENYSLAKRDYALHPQVTTQKWSNTTSSLHIPRQSSDSRGEGEITPSRGRSPYTRIVSHGLTLNGMRVWWIDNSELVSALSVFGKYLVDSQVDVNSAGCSVLK